MAIFLTEQAVPSTPSAGKGVFYQSVSDKRPYFKDDAGTIYQLVNSAGVDAEGAAVASAATTNIWVADGNYKHVTGTTTITSFGTAPYAGAQCLIEFDGVLTLTEGANLVLNNGGSNITTAAGDLALVVADSTTLMKVYLFRRSGEAVAGGTIPLVNEFRLTLTSGTPVTSADVTGATTIYCCPYKGNRIALYDGTRWNIRTSAEFSLALGTLTSGKPYDVFCYDNAGTPTLEFLVWTNDTTRATALAYQDGVLVKSGAVTRRYLGTFYTTSTTTTEDSAANRYLWNYYHRASRGMRRVDATASWTYTTATIRQANNSTANQLNFVIGVSEDSVSACVQVSTYNTSAGVVSQVGIGLDSTTAFSTPTASVIASTGAGYYLAHRSLFDQQVAEGRHYLSWLEYCAATGTQTWIGSSLYGLQGRVFA